MKRLFQLIMFLFIINFSFISCEKEKVDKPYDDFIINIHKDMIKSTLKIIEEKLTKKQNLWKKVDFKKIDKKGTNLYNELNSFESKIKKYQQEFTKLSQTKDSYKKKVSLSKLDKKVYKLYKLFCWDYNDKSRDYEIELEYQLEKKAQSQKILNKYLNRKKVKRCICDPDSVILKQKLKETHANLHNSDSHKTLENFNIYETIDEFFKPFFPNKKIREQIVFKVIKDPYESCYVDRYIIKSNQEMSKIKKMVNNVGEKSKEIDKHIDKINKVIKAIKK